MKNDIHRREKHCQKLKPDLERGRSTIDNIYILQHIIERETAKPQGKVFPFFVDLEAAFDKVARTILWRTMERRGGQERDYRKNKGNIRGD